MVMNSIAVASFKKKTKNKRGNAELLTSAIPFIRVQSKAVITATAEAADGVPTPSIGAQSVYHPAFIYIWKKSGSLRTIITMND